MYLFFGLYGFFRLALSCAPDLLKGTHHLKTSVRRENAFHLFLDLTRTLSEFEILIFATNAMKNINNNFRN